MMLGYLRAYHGLTEVIHVWLEFTKAGAEINWAGQFSAHVWLESIRSNQRIALK
jgi:hypothetical protein